MTFLSTFRRIGLLAALSAGLLLLAACNSSSGSKSTGATVNATLKEYTLTLDKASATAGSVTFRATNGGTIEHEMYIVKTDLAEDALPLSGNAVDEEAAGLEKKGEIAEFAPGDTKETTVKLDAGKYVLFCNVPGHYQQGLHASFTVTAAASSSGGGRY